MYCVIFIMVYRHLAILFHITGISLHYIPVHCVCQTLSSKVGASVFVKTPSPPLAEVCGYVSADIYSWICAIFRSVQIRIGYCFGRYYRYEQCAMDRKNASQLKCKCPQQSISTNHLLFKRLTLR